MTETSERRVAIIGGGFSGVAQAVALAKAGIPFVLFEKGSSVGGTWFWNKYPGLTCDVPVMAYCLSYDPQAKSEMLLATSDELQGHVEAVVERFDLAPHIRLNTEIVAARWSGSDWAIETAGGEVERFDVLAQATGFLHHPRFPQIAGLESFAGTVVHSSQWDRSLQTAGMRVAVIGNGSTGVQLVSALTEDAAEVSLFQRTPQWILPVPNVAVPGWIRRHYSASVERGAKLQRRLLGMVAAVLGGAATKNGMMRKSLALACRRNLARVKDPELRAKLTPTDPPGCKRPVMSWTFYEAIQRDNARLVTDGIAEIEPGGIRTVEGTLHEVDVIVLATGFQSHNYMRPMLVTGRGGLDLNTVWGDAPWAYNGIMVPGFPSMVMFMGPHAPLTNVSPIESAEHLSEFVVRAVRMLDAGEIQTLEPTAEALERWRAEVTAGLKGTTWDAGCTSWYVGGDGIPVNYPFSRKRWLSDLDAGPKTADLVVGVRAAA